MADRTLPNIPTWTTLPPLRDDNDGFDEIIRNLETAQSGFEVLAIDDSDDDDNVDQGGDIDTNLNVTRGDDNFDINNIGSSPPASIFALIMLFIKRVEVRKKGDMVVCVVCMSSVGIGSLLTKLPCGHGYHGSCILSWLERCNSCPLCRFELETDNPRYEKAKRERQARMSSDNNSGGASSSST